tara:strand:- start:469 stop:999 length:531 start_codon:yes stop_codon:yes gene_type:complete
MAAKMTNEIFSIANGLSSDEERVNYLRQNATKAVRALLIYNFSDTKFLLPEGRPELRTEEDFNPQRGYVEGVDDGATLNYEMRKMYLFIEGGHPNLTNLKREALWHELVNSLHPSEADDLWHMKDKKLQDKYKKITHLVAYNSFPEGLQQPQPQPKRDNQGRFSKPEKSKKKKAKT